MEPVALDATVTGPAELPATAYAQHHNIFRNAAGGAPTGLLFDSRNYAIMSIAHPPDSQTPDLNADKDGDRVLLLLEGDLVLQIGENRFRLRPGDAVQIPKGTYFGKSQSRAGAHLVLIRAKPLRSFSMYR